MQRMVPLRLEAKRAVEERDPTRGPVRRSRAREADPGRAVHGQGFGQPTARVRRPTRTQNWATVLALLVIGVRLLMVLLGN